MTTTAASAASISADVQFPRNTGSSEVVSNLNLTGPLKSQVYSAFEPVEQIGKTVFTRQE